MPPPTRLPISYATDEEIVMIAGADYPVVTPKAFMFAYGTDGVFLSSDLWTLTSGSVDFQAQGVVPGMIVQLSLPSNPTWKGLGGLLAIESLSGNSALLRRVGEAVGVGQPPARPGGHTGVTFLVTSLRSPIEDVAYELHEAYAVDPLLPNRKPENMYDQRIFRRLTVFRVLTNQYANINRTSDGDFAHKVVYYQNRYAENMNTASLRWGPTGTSQPAERNMQMRIGR